MCRRAALPLLLSVALITSAAAQPEPAPPPRVQGPDLSHGRGMIEDYFRLQARQIADNCLKDYRTKEEWEKARPELRRQFLEMLGLWPLPARTDLKPVITGKVEMPKYTIEKLHFQSWPGLYVTANLYVPKPAPRKAPAVLYVCGHGNVVQGGVSYGSKVFYQHHPAWLAEHGYVALILDTLELSEIPGEHHGTYRSGWWWWQALGYTPAGIECWNGMRALDYLETRPEVDAKRIGVTGRSGGGATSWWLAAADDRPACIIPVAGIADLQAHLCEGYPGRLADGVIAGHCDCMYMVNTYRWDFPLVAALCAPRPLLLGNSDADEIFPVPGYRRLADKVRRIYDLYGASRKFVLLETTGPHKDTPELRAGAFRWLNRWLKDDAGPVREGGFKPLPPQELKVLAATPEDALNKRIQDFFLKPASLELPHAPGVAKEWWQGERIALETALKEKVFRDWPAQPPELAVKLAADRTHNGLRLRAFDFTSEAGIELRFWLLTSATVTKPSLVVLNALDEADWQEWCRDLGAEFTDTLQLFVPPKRDAAKFEQNRRVLESQKWAFAAVCPRGIGPTRWAEAGSRDDIQYRRRFALVGQTLDGQRVWDVRRALAALRAVPELQGVPLWLQGKRDMAGIALYAGLFEPDVARLDLWHLPASHNDGPIFLNVLRVLDTPQALALAFPKSIRLYVKDEAQASAWAWPLQLQKDLGRDYLKVRVVGD
jgi:Prolyl oligopeptidase family